MADSNCCHCGNCPECGFVRSDESPEVVADPRQFAHGAIRKHLLSRIVGIQRDGQRPLAQLSTRDPADPTIALLDAWAGAMHVLAWNARRLHEDGNFHQSEDPEAMAALANMVGFKPRPILAAQTVQSFEVDEFSELEVPVNTPAGTKIASVPLGDEKPVIFETDSDLEARRAWNKIFPVRRKISQQFDLSSRELLLEGSATGLAVGDTLLLPESHKKHGDKRVLIARVSSLVVIQLENGTLSQTRVTLAGLRRLNPGLKATLPGSGEVIVLGIRASVFGASAPDFSLMPTESGSEVAMSRVAKGKGWVRGRGDKADSGKEGTRQPASTGSQEWPGFLISAPGSDASLGKFDLDGEYDDALPGRILLFDAGSTDRKGSTSGKRSSNGNASRLQMGVITASEVRNRAAFALSQKVTRVTVEDLSFSGNLSDGSKLNGRVRQSTVLIETKRFPLATSLSKDRLPKPGSEDRLLVVGEHDLPPGRLVTVSDNGLTGGNSEENQAEVAVVLSSEIQANDRTLVVFETPLVNTYNPSTLAVYANCVTASHAETAAGGWSIIGSGKRGEIKPGFALKQVPLAQLAATNERGYAPAIEVRVDGRRYEHVDSLYNVSPETPAYTIEALSGGGSLVRFAGALPSGLNNVMAYYRVGGGMEGNLDAGRITTILSPVVGIASSVNLVRAEGGMDVETLDDIRSSAPRRVAALDRVVSRNDYEAFALGFRGVGKAMATHMREGMRPVICLTIATSDMKSPVAGSTLLSGLSDVLKEVAAPGQHVRIEGFDDESVTLVAALKLDETQWRRRDVEQAVRLLLTERFGRQQRRFGQPMRESEILAAIHDVPGIIAARIETLKKTGTTTEPDDISASMPRFEPTTGVFQRAGLLTLEDSLISFTEMA